jgi:hypothetical protein
MLEACVRIHLAAFVMRHRLCGNIASLFEWRARVGSPCKRGSPEPPLAWVRGVLVGVRVPSVMDWTRGSTEPPLARGPDGTCRGLGPSNRGPTPGCSRRVPFYFRDMKRLRAPFAEDPMNPCKSLAPTHGGADLWSKLPSKSSFGTCGDTDPTQRGGGSRMGTSASSLVGRAQSLSKASQLIATWLQITTHVLS